MRCAFLSISRALPRALLLSLSSIATHQALAAACCSISGTASPLITGQAAWEFRLGGSTSAVVAEKFEAERVLFWDTERRQVSQLVTPSVNHVFAEDWQWGLSMDWVQRDYRFDNGTRQKGSGLGDIRVLVAKEWLHPSPPFVWRPQLFVSLEHLFPSGRGIEASESSGLTDITGSDQAKTQLGLHAFKDLSRWRFNGGATLAHVHPAIVSGVSLSSGVNSTASLGAEREILEGKISSGINLVHYRFQPRTRKQSGVQQKVPDQSYFELTPYVSWIPVESWAISLSYSDQTLLGPVENTTLSRRWGLLVKYEIPR